MPGATEALGERFRAAREARGLSFSDVADRFASARSIWRPSRRELEHDRRAGLRPRLHSNVRAIRRASTPKKRSRRSTGRSPRAGAAAAWRPERAARRGAGRRGPLLIWIAATVAVLLIAFVVYNELTMRRAQVAPSAASPPPAPPPASARPARRSGADAAAAPAPAAPTAAGLRCFRAPSWLRVTVDGSVSMEGTFPAGTSKTFHGKNATGAHRQRRRRRDLRRRQETSESSASRATSSSASYPVRGAS